MSQKGAHSIEDSLKAASSVGLASGAAGFLLGGTAGILRGTTPVLFGLASSIQCGCLGTSFWFSRTEVLHAWNDEPSLSVRASALAGGISGGVTALTFRGPRNVLPGIICIAAFGAAGQVLYDRFSKEKARAPTMLQRITSTKWSPLQPLSDEAYASMLREQLLKNQVEIALLDDKIAALKREASVDASQNMPAKKT